MTADREGGSVVPVDAGAGRSRRAFLALAGGVGLGLVAGCASDPAAPQGLADPSPGVTPTPTTLFRPGSATGTFAAAPMQVDLAGAVVTTWGYNGSLPGPEIRLRQGETVRVALVNGLPQETTIHWHGISLPNRMDGVPGVTQDAVVPGAGFAYEFACADAGSYMYHAHVGQQLDLGLYGPLIVEPREPEALGYDREYTVMLDDWRDGLDGIAGATAGDYAGHEGHETTAEPATTAGPGKNDGLRLGGRAYPFFLVSGRPAADPATFTTRRGERVKLRLMNISADTGYLVALAGHRLTVTHSDGMPVDPVTVDAVRLGMGERYDVIVEAANPGVWQLGVVPESKTGFARAVLRYSDASASSAPAVDGRPAELDGRVLRYDDLSYSGERTRPAGEPDRVHDLVLDGTSGISGQRFPNADPLTVAAGELVRVNLRNDASLAHPMHLHGHPFWVATPSGRGPLKDTMLVLPNGGTAAFDFVADNTGTWMFHCHNHYHMENGMARLVDYT